MRQSASGGITGSVTDPSGAVIPGATVQIANPVSGFSRTATTDSKGQFQFFNIPFSPYRLAVTAQGFAPASRSIEVNSAVPVATAIKLDIEGSQHERHGGGDARTWWRRTQIFILTWTGR